MHGLGSQVLAQLRSSKRRVRPGAYFSVSFLPLLFQLPLSHYMVQVKGLSLLVFADRPPFIQGLFSCLKSKLLSCEMSAQGESSDLAPAPQTGFLRLNTAN